MKKKKDAPRRPGLPPAALVSIAGALFAAAAFYYADGSHEAPWQKIPGFHFIAGFAAAFLLMGAAKFLSGRLLDRPADYYED